jgi:hypothetical protein
VIINFMSIRMDASEAVYSQAMVVADETVLADDDEREYPKFVDRFDRCDDEDVDEMPRVAPLDDTDEEEREENIDMGTCGGEEDDDISIIEYDRDNPSLTEGIIFPYRIRTMIMAKFELRQRISAEKFSGHRIISAWMKKLNEKTRGLKMILVKRKPIEAEVTTVDKEKRELRYISHELRKENMEL